MQYPKDFINKIILGDNMEVLKQIPDNVIDMICTSPPYKNDGYDPEKINITFKECYRVLKENSLFFLNFGHLANNKFRPFFTCQLAMNNKFNLNDTIIWVKNHYKPIQGNRRLNNLTEFIFLLYKGKMPKLNRLAIGIPYVDKTNAKRFNKGSDLHCAGNVWYIDYPTINKSEQKLHTDRFPEELSDNCIKLSGLTNGIVLDPYFGSGTVGISALKYNLDYIGIDINPNYCKITEERISKYNDSLI